MLRASYLKNQDETISERSVGKKGDAPKDPQLQIRRGNPQLEAPTQERDLLGSKFDPADFRQT